MHGESVQLAGRAMEFHVSRAARERYGFDRRLFSTRGAVVFADFHAARLFAARINEVRKARENPSLSVRAGDINAMGLIDEVLHVMIEQHRRQRDPAVMARALQAVSASVGVSSVNGALQTFIEHFPPQAVLDGELTPENYLSGSSDGVPNAEIALEELLVLWLHNANPAFGPHRELFDDAPLAAHSAYRAVTAALTAFMDDQPGLPGLNEYGSLLQLLRAPALASPNSLAGQLQFLLRRFPMLLGAQLRRLLASLDLIAEETKPVFPPGPGGEDALVFDYSGQEKELERFSADRDWMPSLVLIAKNAFVWLDQLSRRYGREIRRLDQIPGEELDELARRGVTGLWLIGLWERSKASRRIKQLMGNADAVASAYSLDDYVIAWDLGGEEACARLRDQAWQRGIRLASDMVPNHTGLDSRWMMEHPDWFINLPYSPFPNYSFSGPNLSDDGRAAIYLEDHYFDKSDAAVVFKRVAPNGEERFVYHGNDGTSMPWNDTAQLDYLNPETREAVIQTILHVARQFPIIRFDAAMTLAKKHIQRLWRPEPGHGGAIASRAGLGLTKQEFDAAMPVEFWREVVDRVAQEVPDTLLLAEAFWMMEGFFVRTLGMHRVYNSAFMNMLRDEKNSEYREIIKNTVAFEPEILKRFVNFMNNPDERTAIEQFGKGDKYFGVCTLLVTLPGLPMIGHGQIEGFAEKYGMEYQRAYWDEKPDSDLLDRHERQIFPLMRRRGLFADSENFRLFDLESASGPSEDVYAYSNRRGHESGLVVYHNRFADVTGFLRESAPFATPDGARREDLASALGVRRDAGEFVVFRDQVSNLEYIRDTHDLFERGLFVHLGAYQHHVFLDFRQLRASDGPFRELHDHLNGAGTPNLARAAAELRLRPVLDPYRALLGALRAATGASELLAPLQAFYGAARVFTSGSSAPPSANSARRLQVLAQETLDDLADILAPVKPPRSPAKAPALEAPASKETTVAPAPRLAAEPAVFAAAAAALIRPLADAAGLPGGADRSRTLHADWLLDSALVGFSSLVGCASARFVAGRPDQTAGAPPDLDALVATWLTDPDARTALGVHEFEGVTWLDANGLALLSGALESFMAGSPNQRAAWTDHLTELSAVAATAGYRVGDILTSLAPSAAHESSSSEGVTGEVGPPAVVKPLKPDAE